MRPETVATMVAAAVAAFGMPSPAWACGSTSDIPPNLRSDSPNRPRIADLSPPSAIPSITVQGVERDSVPCCAACRIGPLNVTLKIVAPADDQTPEDQIGYRIAVQEPDPNGLSQPDGWTADSIFLASQGLVGLSFWAGDTHHDAVFSLMITPVDLAGNVGPGYPVDIKSYGDGESCPASCDPALSDLHAQSDVNAEAEAADAGGTASGAGCGATGGDHPATRPILLVMAMALVSLRKPRGVEGSCRTRS